MQHETTRNRIEEWFTREDILWLYNLSKQMYYDTNQKADMIYDRFKTIYDSHGNVIKPGCAELGPGTNRYCMMRENYVIKIGVDKRGKIDNFTEFKRGDECPNVLAKAYEMDGKGLILISEYVTLFDKEDFKKNVGVIRDILRDLSESYIMGDMGAVEKNYANWGYRENGDIVCIDYGYLYKKYGNEHALKCDDCGGELVYTSNYDGFVCTKCGNKVPYTDVRLKMDISLEDLEDTFY